MLILLDISKTVSIMAYDDKKESGVDRQSIIMEDAAPEQAHWAASPMHLQTAMKAGLTQEDAEFLHSIDKAEANKIFSKVDWRLCPMLAVLYLISHLDRANIGYVTSQVRSLVFANLTKVMPKSKASKQRST